ncbi:winged helix-turn-helix domain-containing protein [Deinococcus radiotolerans]|uniref:ArsR family transcriptional regulator n=1 Tax=Deinococcus radiotolerans TaxID=1309407 RepID=A0ABQ2FPR3_9DEIO|nr:winged helix-turn-helix domain-containing protein [Deinococcus radiotolerans]GGL14827.1 hypothetical protein GCM10010844_37080 [Deinococcus radiotolerans]
MPRAWTRLEDPHAARLALHPDYAHLLGLLMTREWTAAELARHLHRPLNATHHRLTRLNRAGLAVTRAEPRRGRPVQHYRAVSDAFLIPYHRTALGSLEDLIGLHEDTFGTLFHRAVVQAGLPLVQREEDIAVRLYTTPGGTRMDITPRAGSFDLLDLLHDDAPALTANWGTLHLTREDAKALQRDLQALLIRYGARSGPDAYLYRLNLAPAGGAEER